MAKEKHPDPGIRKLAEEEVVARSARGEELATLSRDEIKSLVHELSVHQIELEMQNDELRRIHEELEITREKYAHLYDYSPVGYVTVTENGLITEANLTLTVMMGVERRRFIGSPFSPFVVDDDQATYYKARRQLLETGEPLSMALRLRAKGDTWFHAHVECVVVTVPGTGAREIRMAVVNNNERIESERALKASQQAWTDTFNAMPEWVSIIDVGSGEILETNTAGERLLGLPRDQITGGICWELVHGTQGPIPGCPLRQMVVTGKRQSLETCLVNRVDHVAAWQAITADPIMEPNGQVQRAVHIVRDITAITETTAALNLSEEKYRLVVDNASEGIVVVQSGRIVFANPKIEEFTGCTNDELISLPILDRVHPDDRAQLLAMGFENRPDQSVAAIYRFRMVNKEGGIKWILANSIGITWEHRFATLNFFTDITEIVASDLKQAACESRIRETQKIDSIGNLAGGIAHDFNNILSAILGFTELAMEDVERKSSVYDHLEEVRIAGLRAKELIHRILVFSRRSEQKMRPVKIGGVVEEAHKLLRAATPSNIDIRVNNRAPKSTVLADSTQIHQVLINLCTNAVHAMESDGGTLDIGIDTTFLGSGDVEQIPNLIDGNYLKLTVSDTGTGISPAIMDKIFEPYFTTKKQTEGTGLGLAIVQGIINAHQGHIAVYSEPGRGTTFQVYLPLMGKSTAVGVQPPAGELSGGTESILLVDDEIPIVKLLTQGLERLGYRVVAKNSSLEALEAFKADPDAFDLVITDMTMPQMTGDILAQEIKTIRPGIPVILCTGFSGKLNQRLAATSYIDRILMKPVEKFILSETIRALLDACGP